MKGSIFGLVLALVLVAITAAADTLDEMMDRGDWQAAAKLAPELAAEGDARAAAWVAYMLYTGRGWPVNYGVAARWAEQSAAAGDSFGAAILGMALAEIGRDLRDAGKSSASATLVHAWAWLSLANALLPTDLADSDAGHLRRLVDTKMNWLSLDADERRRGEELARRWAPAPPVPAPPGATDGAAKAWRQSAPAIDVTSTRQLLDELEAAVR